MYLCARSRSRIFLELGSYIPCIEDRDVLSDTFLNISPTTHSQTTSGFGQGYIKYWMANIIYLSKGCFLLTLTTVHFIFFGLPALQRFFEHGVSVKKVVQDTKSLLPPAVSEMEKVLRESKKIVQFPKNICHNCKIIH